EGESQGLSRMRIDDPDALKGHLGDVLTSIILAQAAPAADSEQRGQYLVERLKPVAARLEAALQDPALRLAPEQRASLSLVHGNVAATLGEQSGEETWLVKAVAAYRAALKEYTRERVPLDWAMTQNNLGNALSVLGARESGTARLDEAVAAYRAALTERTR